MNIDEYSYLWTTNKEDYVLVNTLYGFGIVNKTEKTALSISDEELEKNIIEKMISEGNKIYDNIMDAYEDK